MRRARCWAVVLGLLVGLRAPGWARTLVVSPQGPFTTPAAALAAAQAGDTIEVQGGTYAGPLVVDKRVRLVGRDWPVLDGGGRGTVVKLTAAGIVFSGFVIRGSGASLDQENSGIAVEAPDVVVAHNRLADTLFGIYLRQAPGSVIRGNVIDGKALPVPRRGDAIRVWYSNGVHITGNTVRRGRDVVLWYSTALSVRDNVVQDGRYGLHFMYCDDARIEHNLLSGNSVGAFLMYSRRLHLHRNTIAHNRGPSGYGVGLKDMDDAVLAANLFLDNRVGAFVDNSPREVTSTTRFQDNVFAFNDTGVSLLPSVRRNFFSNNSFIDNGEHVQVAGGGQLRGNVWRGNFWSDYAGFDADGDGTGDLPYRAERLFEDLLDRYPSLRLFLGSPAAQAIDFAARAFPLVRPQPKLVDPAPRMAPALPQGLPALPRPRRWPLALSATGLLAAGALLALFTRWPPRVPAPAAPPSGSDPMLAVKALTVRYGSLRAVAQVSFEVRAGEAVALWGPNGAGKTTVLRCLLGLLPYQGEVRVAGLDPRRQGKAARRHVGFVPQELHFHDDLSVQETLQLYARLKKAVPDAALLQRLGLAACLPQRVGELSGGMKQRLALAVALLADPPLLLLDEPTANLDAAARQDFLRLVAALRASGKTLIFSSHRQEEVLALADRVLVLDKGRLVADAAPAALRQLPAWQVTLRLHLPGDRLEAARATLAAHGYAAHRNGRSLCVAVPPGDRGRPIALLLEAGIPVPDFDLEPGNHEEA
ncbi:MAG: hypothetical protein KatS3mg131_2752 [Candidatus Tectimicrobiota bacterium]|nr:MAG: hypothetical protein KatS3mg131_2752 [Candidatus Tectomicrobia bacterium]